MPLSKHLQRLTQMDYLIRYKRTGPPADFARKIGVSQSHLYNLLAELRSLGAPVGYCKRRQCYVYTEPVKLQLGYAREP